MKVSSLCVKQQLHSLLLRNPQNARAESCLIQLILFYICRANCSRQYLSSCLITVQSTQLEGFSLNRIVYIRQTKTNLRRVRAWVLDSSIFLAMLFLYRRIRHSKQPSNCVPLYMKYKLILMRCQFEIQKASASTKYLMLWSITKSLPVMKWLHLSQIRAL